MVVLRSSSTVYLVECFYFCFEVIVIHAEYNRRSILLNGSHIILEDGFLGIAFEVSERAASELCVSDRALGLLRGPLEARRVCGFLNSTKIQGELKQAVITQLAD